MAWEVAAGMGIESVVQSRTVSGERKKVAVTGKQQARLRICSPSWEAIALGVCERDVSDPLTHSGSALPSRGEGASLSRKAISRHKDSGRCCF